MKAVGKQALFSDSTVGFYAQKQRGNASIAWATAWLVLFWVTSNNQYTNLPNNDIHQSRRDVSNLIIHKLFKYVVCVHYSRLLSPSTQQVFDVEELDVFG